MVDNRVSIFSVFMLLISPCSFAGTDNPDRWYEPSFVKLQTAGNVGVITVGVGRSYLRNKAEMDLWYGYVPKMLGGIDIHTVAVKARYLPLDELRVSAFRIRPAYVGMTYLQVLGEQYYSSQYERNDSDYYTWTAVHLMPHLGLEISKKMSAGKDIGLIFELGVLDTYLVAYVLNRDVLNLAGLANLSIGLKFSI